MWHSRWGQKLLEGNEGPRANPYSKWYSAWFFSWRTQPSLFNISISSSEDTSASLNIVNNSSPEGFAFHEVSKNYVILAVSHFRSQAKGDDGIPQSIIGKALPTIANYLTKLFNVSLSKGIFPTEWKKSRILALKKYLYHLLYYASFRKFLKSLLMTRRLASWKNPNF